MTGPSRPPILRPIVSGCSCRSLPTGGWERGLIVWPARPRSPEARSPTDGRESDGHLRSRSPDRVAPARRPADGLVHPGERPFLALLRRRPQGDALGGGGGPGRCGRPRRDRRPARPARRRRPDDGGRPDRRRGAGPGPDLRPAAPAGLPRPQGGEGARHGPPGGGADRAGDDRGDRRGRDHDRRLGPEGGRGGRGDRLPRLPRRGPARPPRRRRRNLRRPRPRIRVARHHPRPRRRAARPLPSRGGRPGAAPGP